MNRGLPLRPEDMALLSPDPAAAPRFLAFHGQFDAWKCVSGGPSRQTAEGDISRPMYYREYAFSAERILVSDKPWPTAPILPPSTYLLKVDVGLVVAVPHPVGDRTPWQQPAIYMNVVATPDDETAGRKLVAELPVRAFFGRVLDAFDSFNLCAPTGSLLWKAK